MAESAAHFTATLEAKPSVFEIIAQNSLNSVLHPALQRVTLFLGSINPRKFNWIAANYDEVFFIFNGILQHYYLNTRGASFSEYFYGLQRAPLDSKKLSDNQKKLSLAFLIILPYIKQKLEARINVYRIQNEEGFISKNFTGVFKRTILFLHSTFGCVWGAWTILQYIRYMSDQTPHQTPTLHLLHLKLIYSVEQQDNTGFWSALVRRQLSWTELKKGLAQNTIQSALEVSAFLIQFIQAWNAERTNYSFDGLPNAPPPPKDNNFVKYNGKCPLCLQNWKIPTVLMVSGYVFCFPCIVRHLRENPRCPVTNLPAKSLDIVRLYDAE